MTSTNSLPRVNRRRQRPPGVHKRLYKVDFHQLIATAQEGLEEFAWTIDNEPSGVEIHGAIIVGSVLTEDFRPYESDLDLYLLADHEYENEDGYCRMLRDPQSMFRERLYYTIPDTIAYVDPLGITTADTHQNFIRNPSMTIRVDGESKSD